MARSRRCLVSVALSALLLVLCVVAGVTGTTLRLADRWKPNGRSLERFVWCAALGLAAMAYLVLAVGSAGWLRREVFVAILVLLLAVGSRRFFAQMRELTTRARRAWKTAGWFEKILIVPAVTVLFFSLAAALAPAVGQDELCYHLTQPQNFVRAHAVYAVPYSVNSVWPYLSHMLFTLGLLLQGAEAAKLFHWIFYVLTALAAGAFVRRFAGGRAAWVAAICYLVTPAAMTQAGYAYIDHALALYVFLAFYAAYAWTRERSGGWAWLAGIAAGLAASVKLIGLFSVFPIAALAAAAWFSPDGRRRWLSGIWKMAAGMALAGAVWYVRSWILRGNPVYPFYPALFGGHGFEDPTYVGVHARDGLVGFFLLPWDLTFHPDLFGGEVMGPLFLACVPLVFFWARGGLAAATAAALAVYAVVWFKVDPNIRFFYSAFAWMAVLSGLTADAWRRQSSGFVRHGLPAIFMTIVVFQAVFAPYHYADEARLLFGGNRQHYLEANERSTRIAAEVNRFLHPSDWILSFGEIRGFYFRPRFTLGGDFERMAVPPGDFSEDPKELAAYLKTIGFTHVLLSDLRQGAAEPSRLERVIGDRMKSRAFFKDELVVRSQGHSYVIYRIV